MRVRILSIRAPIPWPEKALRGLRQFFEGDVDYRSLKLTPVASAEFFLVDFFNLRRLLVSQGAELLFTGSLGE